MAFSTSILASRLKKWRKWIRRDLVSKVFPGWLQRLWHRFVLGKTWKRYAGRTIQEVLEEITDEPRLAALLAGQWMDTGGPPDRVAFLMGACVARGLAIEGGAYPVGGSTELAKCLVPVIREAGGRVLVHCAAGVSRSSATVIYYLMTREYMSYDTALKRVRDVRHIAWPNEGFEYQLRALEFQKSEL